MNRTMSKIFAIGMAIGFGGIVVLVIELGVAFFNSSSNMSIPIMLAGLTVCAGCFVADVLRMAFGGQS